MQIDERAAVAVPEQVKALQHAEARLTLLIERDQHKLLDVVARDACRAALAATPAAVQTHAEAAAALCINSALTRIRAGNPAEAIEPLEHALRALLAQEAKEPTE